MPNLLSPIWKGNRVFRESLLLLSDDAGRVQDACLLYPATEIFEVLSSTLETRYEQGRDYTLENGCLRVPEGSTLPRMPIHEYYPEHPAEGQAFAKAGGGWVRFSEGRFYHDKQIVVSYRHAGAWPGEIPASKLDLLPRTAKTLAAGEKMKIVFYGDSITARANASAAIGAAPFQPDWCEMTCWGLDQRYGADVELVNTAVGGTGSQWGVEQAEERAAAHRPDLVVLGFGMNDGGALTTDEYRANLVRMMDIVRAKNPECEFILIATMLPNKEAKGFWGRQVEFREAVASLEGAGAAMADMTSVHAALLTRKAYRDMTGNNINHPNDFLSRAYAQTLLATLGC